MNWLGTGLAQNEHFLYSAHVGRRYETRVRQITLTLGVLLRQDVAFVGMLALDLARAGHFETLLRA